MMDKQMEEKVTTFLGRQHKLLINGQWLPAEGEETIDVVNPATGKVFAKVASGRKTDINSAVAAARTAFSSSTWSRMRAEERANLLNKLADAIEQNADEIAILESMDGGNPVPSIHHADIPMAIGSLRMAASWADKIGGETTLSSPQQDGFSYYVREPLGVAGLITPWNAPFGMAVNKLGPALAVGCTVVLKPAELAPLSAIRLGELVCDVGFPEGVVNIVTGHGTVAGQALAEHLDVNKISFTGSTKVGRSILIAAASNMKRVTLELGGKSPIIVMADADIEHAAMAIAGETCFKTGQFCAAGTRLYVHEKIHDQMMGNLGELFKKIRVGAGINPDVDMGPIISGTQRDRVVGFVEQSISAGAEVVSGGGRLTGEGYFVEPTLLTGVSRDMPAMREEVFGPVLCTARFSESDDIDSIAALANDSNYGLAAKIWTRDLSVAHQLSKKIQSGLITINGANPGGNLPFGGFKQSGIGREGGRQGIESFTEIKSIAIGY